MQQVQRDLKQLHEIGWKEKNWMNFTFKKCLSASKVNENMRTRLDSSQEEVVQDGMKEIPWIQQKSQEVFIKHGRGLK